VVKEVAAVATTADGGYKEAECVERSADVTAAAGGGGGGGRGGPPGENGRSRLGTREQVAPLLPFPRKGFRVE